MDSKVNGHEQKQSPGLYKESLLTKLEDRLKDV
jgi:hypothetical protein